MSYHYIKCWPEFFESMIQGIKRFEYRKNDRNYTVGDQLVVREFLPEPEGLHTGRVATFQVLRVWDEIPDIPDGFCIMEVSGPQSVYYLDPNWTPAP